MAETYVLTADQKVQILLLHRSLLVAQQSVQNASTALEAVVSEIMKENDIKGQLDLSSLTFVETPTALSKG